MQKNKYDEVKRLAEDRDTWRKTTRQPSDTEDGIAEAVGMGWRLCPTALAPLSRQTCAERVSLAKQYN